MSDFSKEATFGTITRQAREIESLRSRLAAVEAENDEIAAKWNDVVNSKYEALARLAAAEARLAEAFTLASDHLTDLDGCRTRLSAAEKDAERYRWLRIRLLAKDINEGFCCIDEDEAPDVDAAIDAHLAAAREWEKPSTRTCQSCGFTATSDGWLNCPRCTAAVTPTAAREAEKS